ncbi:MAG: 4Fe-4S binding protein [Bacteriovoracaceae bacterium]|nr:4Fe-4S binding protein [Bacteriovoracaceae bacterium]
MKTRMEQMKELLDNRTYFKLVCGAGNEDTEEVRRLSTIYTLAGSNGFDVSANPKIVKASMEAIDKAYELAPKLGIEIPVRPFITVSVGMPGDHHVRKAIIDPEKCVSCDLCIPVCPTDAIPKELVVIPDLCIGCGHCSAVCPPRLDAIYYEHNDKALRDILPECLEAGAENIELHAAVDDNDQILEEWKIVSECNPNNFISMCLDRFHLSNFQLVERIKKAKEIAGDRLIIQADGIPMSGGQDNFNTTLQAIAIADIIHKEFHENKRNKKYKDIYVLLSGGTNSKTAELANICDTNYHGLSLGTHARKIVREYTLTDDFLEHELQMKNAITIAKDLVTMADRVQ